MQWYEQLQKAKKRLSASKKCYELYGDEDSLSWIEEDKQKVKEIEKQIEKVKKFMDAHNIK